jgi:PAS domain S-box-containing protein
MSEPPTSDGSFESLLEFIRSNRGFDFAGYKRPSLVRRFEKRMSEVGIRSHDEYRGYLEAHPEEFAALFNTILINATAFFGDAPSWEFLASEIVPRVIDSRGRDGSIRIWSTGPASGEEAYSLAMLFAEALGERPFQERVKIYATDIDDEALADGRRAAYPRKALDAVDPKLRDRYFERVDERYVFRPELRRAVTFGRHDLLQDPPISRVDLLSSRNTLMYFNPDAQARILTNFAFALRDTGFLFLGKSELLMSRSKLFVPVDLKRRVFSKVPRLAVLRPVPGEPPEREELAELAADTIIREAGFEGRPSGAARWWVPTGTRGERSSSWSRSMRPEDEASQNGAAADDLRLLEFAGVAHLTTDAYGIVLEANEAAGGLLAVQARFLNGKPLASLVDLSDRKRFRRLLLELQQGADHGELEVQLRRRNVVALDVRLTVAHVRANGHRALGWLVQDITELRQAERQLWELNADLESRASALARAIAGEHELLHGLVEQLPVGLLVVDAARRPVVANERLSRVLGVELPRGRAVPGADWPTGRDVDGGRYRPGDWPFARSLARGEPVDGERIELHRADGSGVSVEVTSTPLRASDGSIRGAIASFHDVTERVRAERAEREFIENAAHELRTPVAAISGAVEALQLGAKSEPEALDTFLAHLARDCERLVRLGAALLTLARAQGGHEQPRLEPIELRPLLDELAAQLRPSPGVEVHVACPPDLAALTNRDLLWHALANLAANASRFTARGSIELRVRETGGRTITVEVADTGPGIPEDERDRVTERFYSAGPKHGYGLGLAIAKQAAEAAGGRLELSAGEVEGTVAGIRLSAARVVSVRP